MHACRACCPSMPSPPTRRWPLHGRSRRWAASTRSCRAARKWAGSGTNPRVSERCHRGLSRCPLHCIARASHDCVLGHPACAWQREGLDHTHMQLACSLHAAEPAAPFGLFLPCTHKRCWLHRAGIECTRGDRITPYRLCLRCAALCRLPVEHRRAHARGDAAHGQRLAQRRRPCGPRRQPHRALQGRARRHQPRQVGGRGRLRERRGQRGVPAGRLQHLLQHGQEEGQAAGGGGAGEVQGGAAAQRKGAERAR